MDARDIKTILAAGTQQRFPAHSVLVNQGYPAGYLFLLLAGRARRFYLMESQKPILLRVASREVFGEAAMLARPAAYLVSAEVVTDSNTLVWNRSTIRSLSERYPRLAENALSISFDYLIVYRAAHASLVCKSAAQRLAHVLSNLAHGIGEKVPGGVELDVRNEELANEANISLFTAGRLLSAWQREGILVRRRGKVVLRFPDRLLRRSNTNHPNVAGTRGNRCISGRRGGCCTGAMIVAMIAALDVGVEVSSDSLAVARQYSTALRK
jgi:CRP-like cAMP-binding protein